MYWNILLLILTSAVSDSALLFRSPFAKCYDLEMMDPDFLRCPSLNCEPQNITVQTKREASQCCTMLITDQVWVCCGRKCYLNPSDAFGYPKCSQSTCKVKKSILLNWKGNACCDAPSIANETTCCLESRRGKFHVHCYPRAIQKPQYLQCSDIKCSPDEPCQNETYQPICCVYRFSGLQATCCFSPNIRRRLGFHQAIKQTGSL